jgi:hypothetical protein
MQQMPPQGEISTRRSLPLLPACGFAEQANRNHPAFATRNQELAVSLLHERSRHQEYKHCGRYEEDCSQVLIC